MFLTLLLNALWRFMKVFLINSWQHKKPAFLAKTIESVTLNLTLPNMYKTNDNFFFNMFL